MNNKAFTISLALAGMAVFMIYSYVSSLETDIKNRYGAETAVVVAKKDINSMDMIYENMIEIVKKPKNFIEPGRTSSKDEVKGFIAAVPIRKGEQITLNKIIEAGVQTGLARQVSVGKRAVAIQVTDSNAVNRLLKPGDRVDITVTVDPPGITAKGSQITKMLLQDVTLLAVGEWVSSAAPRKDEKDELGGKTVVRKLNLERNYNTVTVELDPDSAMQVILAQDIGSRLTLLLRNNDDTERVSLSGKTLLEVLGADQNKIIRGPAQQR